MCSDRSKYSAYWPSAESLAQQVGRFSPIGPLCYELAPTGRVHPGILRTLAFAERIQRALCKDGRSIEFIIRINDLAPEKGPLVATNAVGRRIAASLPSRWRTTSTALQALIEELDQIYDRSEFLRPKIVLLTDIYKTDTFRKYLSSVYDNRLLVHSILAKYKNRKTHLLYPVCPVCHLVGSVEYDDLNQGIESECSCKACNSHFVFHAIESEALITFKVELAIVWQILRTSIDLHGQDHIEAYEATTEIARALGFIPTPLPARVNSTFNEANQKVSKSRDNFEAVLSLDDASLKRLLNLIDLTPSWRPMLLRRVMECSQ